MDPRLKVEALIRDLGLETRFSDPEIDAVTQQSTSSSSPSPDSLPSLPTTLTTPVSNLQTDHSAYSIPESFDISDETSGMDTFLPYYALQMPVYPAVGVQDDTTLNLTEFSDDAPSPDRPTMPLPSKGYQPMKVHDDGEAKSPDAENWRETEQALLLQLKNALQTVEAQQGDITTLTNACVQIKLDNARLEEQLRHVEETEEARQELIALQIENARLHEASDARQADRLQFERTVKLQAMLDSCQIELDACRADRNRFAELNETLIAEKQSKHSQLMRAHADIDSLTQQCADARIECDKLRHQMDLAQSTLPAKELQILKLRDELDGVHSRLNSVTSERLQLQAAIDVSQERHTELIAEMQRMRQEMDRMKTILASKDEKVTVLEAQLTTCQREKVLLQEDLHRVLSRRGDLAALKMVLEQQLIAQQQIQQQALLGSVAADASTATVGVQAPTPRILSSLTPRGINAATSPIGSPRYTQRIPDMQPVSPLVGHSSALTGEPSGFHEPPAASGRYGDAHVTLVDVTESTGSHFPKWYRRLRQIPHED